MKRIVSVLCLMFLAGCSSLSSNSVADPPMDATNKSLAELVDGLAKPLIASQHNIGIVVGVLDDKGAQHVYGYGHRALGSDQVPDGNTIFGIGSLTKSFTSLLMYNLIKDGKISGDETVGDLMPSEDFSDASRRITLTQLMNHTSGLPRQPNDLAMVGNLIHYSFTGDDIYSHITQQSVYEFLKTFDPSDSETGHYRYSNIGMGLLGQLIEAQQHRSLEKLFAATFYRPLGLHDTTYVLNGDQQKRLAAGYVGDSPFFVARNTEIAPWKMNDIFKGAAGLYSTANDLLKLARYRLTIHDIPVLHLPIGSAFDMGLTPPKTEDLSLGWNVDIFKADGIHIIYQHGMVAGYSAYMGLVPERNIAVVVLYNNFDWDDQIGHNILLSLSRKPLPPTPEDTR